jgi:hypothetical protein
MQVKKMPEMNHVLFLETEDKLLQLKTQIQATMPSIFRYTARNSEIFFINSDWIQGIRP